METDGLPVPRRRWSMITIGMVISLAVLDGVIANVGRRGVRDAERRCQLAEA